MRVEDRRCDTLPGVTLPPASLRPLRLGSVVVDPPLLLAPMAGHTNHAFRRLCREEGGCGLVCSELLSARAMHYKSSRSRTLDLLDWTPEEHPLAVQLFGSDPREMAEAARMVASTGASVVDVNMGCWVPKVARKGGGAGLLRDVDAARAVVQAVVQAVDIPVTVKVRLGWEAGERTAVAFARAAASCGVAGLTVHGRTAAQGFEGDADWGGIAEVVEAVPGLPVIGNGDVASPADARRLLERTGCAGVMIGRAALGAPWIFRHVEHGLRTGEDLPEPDLAARARVALRHARLALGTSRLPEAQVVQELRGQLSRYRLDAPGQTVVRNALVRAASAQALEEFLESLAGS